MNADDHPRHLAIAGDGHLWRERVAPNGVLRDFKVFGEHPAHLLTRLLGDFASAGFNELFRDPGHQHVSVASQVGLPRLLMPGDDRGLILRSLRSGRCKQK